MKREPLLTVIIPVYNVSKYIRQCLDSVAGQTLKDIQVICVDDGSTDGSDEIVLEYVKNDPRFMLVRQKNCGAGTARNNGIQYAVGKYVHYLDSDDWLDLEAYKMVVDKLERFSCDCCFFQKYNYDNETGELNPTMRAFPTNDYLTSFEINPSFFIYNVVVPWNKVTRRDIIVSNGMRYDEIACANDRTFYFSLVKSCKSILVTRDNLIYYRINNSGSLIGTNRSIHYDAHFAAYDSTMKWYEDSDDTVKRMVVDVCIADCFNFFDKAANIYKVRIYRQLHEFFNRIDLSFFNGDFSPYAWGERMIFVRDHLNGTPEFFRKSDAVATVVPVCREDLHPGHPVIVSLTSYPARIGGIHLTIRSIMIDQSVRPDRTILWLSEEQFPNKEDDLPYTLLDLKKDGLEIRFVEEDLKPHKKYFYTMQEIPDAAVITVDDDVIYWPDTVECLLRSYKKHPRCVSGMRVHRMTFTDGKVNPYAEWDFNDDTLYDSPTMTAMATGVGGILYPPHLVSGDGFDKKAIIATCLRGDDLWLKVQEVRNNVPTVLASFNRALDYIDGSQETALWKLNKGRGENDIQLENILKHYHNRTITDRIYREFPGVNIRLSILIDCSAKGTEMDALADYASKLGRDMDAICYNVQPSRYKEFMGRLMFSGKMEVVPSKEPLPLYFAAKCAVGRYVLAIPGDMVSKYPPEMIRSFLKDPGHDQYDVIPGAGSGRAFDVNRSFLLRRELADSMFYHLSDRLTASLYRYRRFDGPLTNRDVRPEYYNGLFLNNLRGTFQDLSLEVEENAYTRTRIIADVINGTSSDATVLDRSCYFDGSRFIINRKLCPICGTLSDSFLPTGRRIRDNAICPVCGSYERHRALWAAVSRIVGSRRENILVMNMPGSVNSIVKEMGVDRTVLEKVLSTTKKYDLIVGSHSLHRLEDIADTLGDLYSKMKESSIAVLTAPLSKKKTGYFLDETPLGLPELKYLFARLGFRLNLLWNKSLFTKEEMIFYGLTAGESVLTCEIDPTVDQERLGVSFIRAFDLGTVYRDGIGVKPAPKTAELWFKAAADLAKDLSTEDQMKILWEEGSETSILQLKSMVESSVAKGEAIGEHYLGLMYGRGVGMEKDLVAATDHLRIAYEKDQRYVSEFAQTLYYRKKRDCVSELVRISNKTEDPKAMYLTAKAFNDDDAVPREKPTYVKWLERSASKGYMDAVHEYTDYLWNEGTPSTISKMIGLCNLYIKDGDRQCIMHIARAYASGRGVKKDLSKTRLVLQEAFRNGSRWAEKELIDVLWNIGTPDALNEISYIGSPQSALYIGRAYKVGKGVPKDMEKAVEWYTKAKRMGASIEASEYYDLMVNAKIEDEYTTAVEGLLAAADDGNPKVMYALGKAYRDGIGVPVDLLSAERCFRYAVQNGHRLSVNVLFDLLWKQKRFDDAAKVALVARDRDLMDKVVEIYRNGKGVRMSTVKVTDYLRSMVDNGMIDEKEYYLHLWNSNSPSAFKELSERAIVSRSPVAHWFLGRMYRYGRGIGKDRDKAVMHYREAYNGGLKDIRTEFADVLWLIGTQESCKEMVEILSGDSDPECLGRLGKAYKAGKGVKKNPEQAIGLFMRADMKWTYREAMILVRSYKSPDAPAMMQAIADRGENEAYLYLGRMYREGVVVKKDMSKSIEYYRKAYSKGVRNSGDELLWSLWSLDTEASCREVVRLASKIKTPNAEGYLGRAYRNAKGAEKDLDEAAKHMRIAYKGGVKWAAAELFDILWNIGTPESKKEMISVVSSNSSDPECLGRLGRAYRMGKGVKQDIPKSVRAYLDSGLPWAYDEAFKAVSQYDGKEKVELMERLANAGVSEARASLGKLYLETKDYAKAAKYSVIDDSVNELLPRLWDSHSYSAILELSKTNNGPLMESYLGKMYRYGAGVEKNPVLAAEHLRKALDGGIESVRPELFDVLWNIGTPESKKEMIDVVSGCRDPECLGRLGRAYRIGKGVNQDMVEAVRYSLESGLTWACKEVVDSVYNGRLTVDGKTTVQILEEIASKGVPQADLYVGKTYRFGITVDKDPVKAMEPLRRAVSAGLSEATPMLFDVLWNSKDPKTYEEMLELVRTGANEGDPECMGRIGRMYKAGLGVKKDIDLANKWFTKASLKDPKWEKERVSRS